jgi:hypothetical protein
MANGNRVSDALALEQLHLSKVLNEAAEHAQREISAVRNKLAASGQYRSGRAGTQEAEIRLAQLRTVTEAVIAKRRELGQKIPELLMPQEVAKLRVRLDSMVDAHFNSRKQEIALGGRQTGSANINSEASYKAMGIKGTISRELNSLQIEARLGIYEESRQMPTFNISNSTIANLNLGTVLGDLTVSMQNLSNQGQERLAEAIGELTGAIGKSAEIQDPQRKELLEHLSVVSEETARPAEKRKMGPLRSSIAFLQNGVTAVTQLATLWVPIERLLKATGLLD